MRVTRCVKNTVLVAPTVTGIAVVDDSALRANRCIPVVAVACIGARSRRDAVLVTTTVAGLAAVD